MMGKWNKRMPIWLGLLVMLIGGSILAQTGTISGKVTDTEGNALPGVNVLVQNTTFGASTGPNGEYTVKYLPAGTYTLTATMLGYEEQSVTVEVTPGTVAEANFTLKQTVIPTEAVVVSGSRQPEKITDAPVTVSVLDAVDIRRNAGFVFGEAISKAKGVDFYRTGVDGVAINSRGFMTAFSYRFQTFADGRNSMLPGASVGPGNLLPVAKEDIQQIELVLGPSSALYGPNASNGVLNVTTKHPRQSLGTTLVLGGGENSTLITRARHAGAVNDKIAYKANFEFLRAEDWVKNDTAAVTRDSLGNVIHATMEDPDFTIRHLRFDASVYYSFSPSTELVATYARAETHNIVTTNISRNQVDGWVNDIQQLRFHSPHFYATVYRTGNSAGNTHNINTKAAFIEAGMSEEDAIEAAKFIDKSQRYNAEMQYNTAFKNVRIVAGANYEDNRPVSEGTFLADTGDVEISIKQFGVYGQVEVDLPANFQVVAAGRYDTHDNYDAQFSPRVGLLYKVPGYGTFRVTYNQAYQAPAVIQQELLLRGADAFGFPVWFRGNISGYTLADGTKIDPLQPERSEGVEVGYRGMIGKHLFLDVNAYRTKYKDFISPLVLIGNPFAVPVAKIGDRDLTTPEFTLTYVNFGEVNIQGLDVGLRIQLTPNVSLTGSYSFVEPRDLFPTPSDTAGGKI
ncbi:MAG: TonB-dependent receptor, partial [Calditrichaeota bacterium]